MRLTAVLLACSYAADKDAADKAAAAKDAADKDAPTWQTSSGLGVFKLEGSTNHKCANVADIRIHEVWKTRDMDSSKAVISCSDECEAYSNEAEPTWKCVSFEVADIDNAAGLPGMTCSLYKGTCTLDTKDKSHTTIRGQYYIEYKDATSMVPLMAGGGALVLLVAGGLLLRKKPAPPSGKRGLGGKTKSVTTDEMESLITGTQLDPAVNPFMSTWKDTHLETLHHQRDMFSPSH